jgi:cytolysin (calcineurin-like family phosphatase)
MKSLSIFIAFLLGIIMLYPTGVIQAAGKSDEALLKNIDALRAVEFANEWKWSKKDVKTSIDSREVIFEFPDGKVKRIALPKDKMYVAVAPYIKNTHT